MKISVRALGAATLICLAGCAPFFPAPAPARTRTDAAVTQAPPLQEPFPSVLARWNFYRQAAGVPPIEAEPQLNQAALHHAKYLVNNHIDAGDGTIINGRLIESGWNASAHSESEGNQWYTEDGAKWADAANVIRGAAIPKDGAALVDEQAARLDSLTVVDPQLVAVGFGIFCASDDCAGVIVYKHGLTKSQFLGLYEGNAMDWNGMLGAMPFTSARLRRPIQMPSSGMQFPSSTYRGGEYLNPLASCPGYKTPAGVPIVLELGAATQSAEVKISSNSLTENGAQLETCAFDAIAYANPDGFQQRRVRQVLRAYGAVAVIPKNPLQPGHTYAISIVADGEPYNWSFSIAPDAKLSADTLAPFTTRVARAQSSGS